MEYLFVETTPFTQAIVKLGLDEDLRKLQDELLRNPTAGDLDPGACGLRKVRMTDATRGQGKRFAREFTTSSFRIAAPSTCSTSIPRMRRMHLRRNRKRRCAG
jgi:hypothetical protein